METFPWEPDWVSPPCETIAESLEERGISAAQFAVLCETTEEAVQRLLRGDDAIGIKWARLLNTHIGVSEEFWLALQGNFDMGIAKGRKVW